VVSALAVTTPARADFISMGPTDEGTRQIVGTSPAVQTEEGPTQFLPVMVDNLHQTKTDSITEFSLEAVSTLPRGVVINSATFSFAVAGAQTVAAPGSLTVNGYQDGDGIVGLGDFPKATTLLGSTGPLANGAVGSLDVPFTFDVTSFIQQLANNGGKFVGFHFEGPAGDSSATVWGASAPLAAERPTLSITFTPNAVPEPSGVLLTGLGAAGLAVMAWRQRSRAAR
jgi:hypothetical protein